MQICAEQICLNGYKAAALKERKACWNFKFILSAKLISMMTRLPRLTFLSGRCIINTIFVVLFRRSAAEVCLHTYIRKHPAEGVASYKRQAKQISGYAANVVYCHRERTYRYENIDQKHVNAGYRGGYHAVLRPVADPYGTAECTPTTICLSTVRTARFLYRLFIL